MSAIKRVIEYFSQCGFKKRWLVPLFVWTALVFGSLAWNIKVVDQNTTMLARDKGKAFIQIVKTFRLLYSHSGGVYVPITENTQPNPFLDDPYRDVTTEAGMKLTKINPAYMTRQIASLAKENNEVFFHLTSLKPIRSQNKADEWETATLKAFENGEKERLEFLGLEVGEVYRYMEPLFVKSSCMKCHAFQGYKVGDIRGGISITMPAKPFIAAKKEHDNNLVFLHIIILVIGLGGMVIFLSYWQQTEERLKSINESLEQRVEERTLEITQINKELTREIAEREQAEEALKKAHDALEIKVEERTRELKQKQAQLVHSGRLAALGELSAGIAHELGQPLQIILSVSRILNDAIIKSSLKPDTHLPMIDKIFNQVERASVIIHDMRTFARFDYSETLAVIDLNIPAGQSLSFFREQFYHHQISLETDFPDNLPKVKANFQKFQQIVVNLLSNALYAVNHKQTKPGEDFSKKVCLRLYHQEEGNRVILEVADNGMGMSKKERDYCLEPFFTTKEVGEGTGLGLSILYGIVQGFGGEVNIESEQGKGTVFKVILPVAG